VSLIASTRIAMKSLAPLCVILASTCPLFAQSKPPALMTVETAAKNLKAFAQRVAKEINRD
jgi:hypothetical protein